MELAHLTIIKPNDNVAYLERYSPATDTTSTDANKLATSFLGTIIFYNHDNGACASGESN